MYNNINNIAGGNGAAEMHNVGSTLHAFRTNTQLLLEQPDAITRGELQITLRDDHMEVTLDGQEVVTSETDKMFRFHHSRIYLGISRSVKYRSGRSGNGICGLKIRFLGEFVFLTSALAFHRPFGCQFHYFHR